MLLVGSRFGEVPSADYSLLKSPYPDQKLVHVHPDSGELGRVYRPTLAINASPDAFAEAFAKLRPASPPSWRGEAERLHKSYLAWSTPPETGPGAVQMGPIMTYLESVLPEDAILTNGAGNYATWIHRFHRFRRFATQGAPTSGSMGYGTPAAVAAKALFPEREVIAFAGDGCFLMNGQEFATAVQYDLPIIVIVVNNGIYGTIRMHQERDFPGRVIAHRPEEPGFRGPCPRLWRPRRNGGKDCRLRAGFRARAGKRPPRDHRDKARSRSDHADEDADRDPREAMSIVRRRPAPGSDRRLDRPDARPRSTA